MKIGLSYEVRGMVENITSYDGASVVKNEVVNEYNNLGQVTKQYQEHSGAKDGSTPSVLYSYDSTPASGEYSKDSRKTMRRFDSSDRVYFNYGASAGAGDKMSRVDNLADDAAPTTEYARYQYLGMSTFVVVVYPEIDSTFLMTLDHGTANAYVGLDRFNRIVDMLWDFHSVEIDRFQYGYDRNSNPLFASNKVDTDSGNEYAYDEINRLIDAKRGPISSGVVADPDHREVYDLDATGNWNGYFVQDGQTTWKQRREFNQANEIVDLTNWVVPEYDLAGNMTTIPQPADLAQGYALTWDGWNRLVKVVEGTTTIAEYGYDGLMRRQTEDDQTDVRHFYYSLAWQVVEERLNALTTADAEYVWGIRYIDDLVRRLKGEGANSVIYALKDRMWSISSLVETSKGTVLERYVYDPYGKPTVLTGTFGPRSSSLYSWSYLFQGQEWDSLTGLYQFRMRYYHSGLGLFVSRDPIVANQKSGSYRFGLTSPMVILDPLGLDSYRIEGEYLIRTVCIKFEFNEDIGFRQREGKTEEEERETYREQFTKQITTALNCDKYRIRGPRSDAGYIPRIEITDVGEEGSPDLTVIAYNDLNLVQHFERNTNTIHFGPRGHGGMQNHHPVGRREPLYACHEFLHYLGFRHPGKYLSRENQDELKQWHVETHPNQPPQSWDYWGDIDSISGAGEEVRPYFYEGWFEFLEDRCGLPGFYNIRAVEDNAWQLPTVSSYYNQNPWVNPWPQ